MSLWRMQIATIRIFFFLVPIGRFRFPCWRGFWTLDITSFSVVWFRAFRWSSDVRKQTWKVSSWGLPLTCKHDVTFRRSRSGKRPSEPPYSRLYGSPAYCLDWSSYRFKYGKNYLTWKILKAMYSLAENTMTSMNAISTSCRGLVLPITAPNDISTAADVKSADIKLWKENHRNNCFWAGYEIKYEGSYAAVAPMIIMFIVHYKLNLWYDFFQLWANSCRVVLLMWKWRQYTCIVRISQYIYEVSARPVPKSLTFMPWKKMMFKTCTHRKFEFGKISICYT